ncbi:unnamed protein product [Miscanthus lutarioriparius]|uniref:Uncharacterized protein n=1 Tax=Miscanthus lutarioriparius TaxID=422564 RepID=A0A811NBT7_9POAL|nr:unnamed protein product [Miscanthus lutarioriparius]
MGGKMLVKYYKYWGEKYGERPGDREKRGEKDKGDQLLNIVIFFCVGIDPWFKLSNYVKMATMVMFGDEIGQKLWATVNTYFRALFEEYRELYAPSPSDKVPAETQETPEFCSGLMSSIIAQQMSNKGSANTTVKSELDKTSLTPTMVERLVCTNDWFRGNNYISVEEDTEALAKLEEEIGALAISKDSTIVTAS